MKEKTTEENVTRRQLMRAECSRLLRSTERPGERLQTAAPRRTARWDEKHFGGSPPRACMSGVGGALYHMLWTCQCVYIHTVGRCLRDK